MVVGGTLGAVDPGDADAHPIEHKIDVEEREGKSVQIGGDIRAGERGAGLGKEIGDIGVLGLEERNVVAVRSHLRYDGAVVEKVALQGGGAHWARRMVVAESGRLLAVEQSNPGREGSEGPAAHGS